MSRFIELNYQVAEKSKSPIEGLLSDIGCFGLIFIDGTVFIGIIPPSKTQK